METLLQSSFVLRKKRTVGEILTDTFLLVRTHFKAIIVPYLILCLPLILLSSGMNSFFLKGVLSQNNSSLGTGFQTSTGLSSGPIFLNSLVSLVLAIAVSTFIPAFLKAMEESETGNPAPGMVFNVLGRNVFYALLYAIILAIILVFACIPLFIPAIWIAVFCSISLSVLVFEGGSFGKIFSRSRLLIKGHWWETFGLIIICYIVILAVSMTELAIIGVVEGVTSMNMVTMLANVAKQSFFIQFSIQFIGSLLNLFFFIPLSLQYFNLLEWKGSGSLSQKIDTLGETPSSERTEKEDY